MATDVIPEEELVQYLSPRLLEIPLDTLNVKVTVVLCAFLFFTASLFPAYILVNMVPALRAMKFKEKVFTVLAVTRSIFGFFAIFLAGYALLTTTNLDRDLVFGRTNTCTLGTYTCFGFFIFELFLSVASDIYFKTFSKMLFFHHFLAMLWGLGVVYYDAYYSYFCKGILLEMSTPFSCICFVLLKAGMGDSKLWKINQMVLIHTFHLRNVVECMMYYMTFKNWKYVMENSPIAVLTIHHICMFTVFFGMTPYWTYKKTMQLFLKKDFSMTDETKEVDAEPTGKKNI